jgi:hypothetical protein
MLIVPPSQQVELNRYPAHALLHMPHTIVPRNDGGVDDFEPHSPVIGHYWESGRLELSALESAGHHLCGETFNHPYPRLNSAI